MSAFLDLLQKKIVIADGAMGTLLQASGLKAGELPEVWNITHPDVLVDIHTRYYNSGSDFVGYCMWGEYTVRGMMNMDWEYVVIPPGGFVIADTNITSNKIKCFLWQSISDISVISDFREREAN